jgi:hypothetical protein
VNRKEVRFLMNLKWFRRKGPTFVHDFTQRTPEPLMFNRFEEQLARPVRAVLSGKDGHSGHFLPGFILILR